MVILYYGTGKGKTTAALGLALRASGYGKKILIIQFVKSPDFKTGEDVALGKIKNLKHQKFGLGFVAIRHDQHSIVDHQAAALQGLSYAISKISNFDIIICDEILGCIKSKLISQKAVLHLISLIKKGQTLVLTGRPRYQKIIEKSDLVTRMQEIKHPFQIGQQAQKAIDY